MRLFVFLSGIIGCQAVFKPNNHAELQAAVGTCGYSSSLSAYICTGGCLGETGDGSCPIFAASNDATENPYGPISDWDISLVTSLNEMFSKAVSFNQDLSNWDTSSVTTLRHTFKNADAFNSDLSKWDVSSVTSLLSTFISPAFNGDVSTWNVAKVNTLSSTFNLAGAFNGDISKWNVAQVTNIQGVLKSAVSFNGDLSKWNTGKVTNTKLAFNRNAGSPTVTLDLSTWDTGSVTNMAHMFGGGLHGWGFLPYADDMSRCTMNSAVDSHFRDCQYCPNGCDNTEPSMVCKRGFSTIDPDDPRVNIRSFKCNCDTGSYKNIDWASGPNVEFDPYTPPCVQCPMGTYQNVAGQLSCETCPPGRSTTVLGSTLETECLNATDIRNKFVETQDTTLVPAYNIANSCG